MHTEAVMDSVNAYVRCRSKICGSLDEILSVTMGSCKILNSNMTLTVLNLHQKTDPKVQQDFKGQGHYDKVKSRSHHYATPPNQCPYQASTSYTLQFPRYSPDKIL